MAEQRQRNESGQYAGTLSEERVLEAVGVAERVATTSEVAEAVGKSIDTARRWLNDLHEQGRIGKKKVGARGVVWWVEEEEEDSDEDDKPPTATLKELSKGFDKPILAGDTVFEDGIVRVRPDKPYHFDHLIYQKDDESGGVIICEQCRETDDTPKQACVNCASDMTGIFIDEAKAEWEAKGWRRIDGEVYTGDHYGVCPDCVAKITNGLIPQVRDEGLVNCLKENHSRHRPDSKAFAKCREKGNIPLTDDEHRKVMEAHADS